jgi:alkylhydroperoxidase/carboxymuconolactone decarboxylase family protein YurZ
MARFGKARICRSVTAASSFAALDNGCTKDEIAELITHLAFYSGWPTAMTAAGLAKDVFESR